MTVIAKVIEAFGQKRPLIIASELLNFAPEQVALWLTPQDKETVKNIIQALPLYFASRVIGGLPIEAVKDFFKSLESMRARSFFHQLSSAKKEELIKALPGRYSKILSPDDHSFGDTLWNTNFSVATSIHETKTIKEFYALVQAGSITNVRDVFICDQEERLLGRLDLTFMLAATNNDMMVGNLEYSSPPALRIGQSVASAIKSPGFLEYDTLPIVDSDRRLLGSIRYKVLSDTLSISPTENTSLEEVALTSMSDAFSHSIEALGSIWDRSEIEKDSHEHR